MRRRSRAVCSLLSGALLTTTLAVGAVAAPAEPRPSTESPALSSTNPEPTVVDGVSVPTAARPGFRILPYLQAPAADHMRLSFFSESGSPATVEVHGPGLPAEGLVLEAAGEQNPATRYQDGELERADFVQPGVSEPRLIAEQGTWLRSADLYKYGVLLEDLRPNSDYDYTVTLDGYRHEATFTTNQASGRGVTEPVHLIAFSDTETDPVGRVTHREWVKNPLAEGSEPRPSSEDSAWASTFGTNARDGELQLRYALTEDVGQRENNRHIAAADPDLLLVAGDVTERASWQTHWDEWFRHFAGDQGAILDTIPTITSPGNHEVYGYCASVDDCTPVVRARALYNWYFDTNAEPGQQARDAYHRTDHGPVTVISIDSTNGTDQVPDEVPEEMTISGDDATLTPEQYGTDTQNAFTREQYARDFPIAVENGWWGKDADPAQPDQPNFMPGSKQYAWLEDQLADARDRGQIVVVQYHHVAYSNGTHGTTMGHEHTDAQPGTPMRHLQPLLEKYDVAAVFSGHDETFQASYVDEAGDGAGVYHWDLGVASDGLRGEKMIPNPEDPEGAYVPLAFNTHSVWMAQRDEPELWRTDENGVRQLVSGGKHYGHLDVTVEPYAGEPLADGTVPASVLVMQPMAVFPVLDENYELERTEKRALESGRQVVYLDAHGRPIPHTAPATDAPGTPEGPAGPEGFTHTAVLTADNTAAGAREVGLHLPEGTEVVTGDWDGDGIDTLAHRDGNRFVLDATSDVGDGERTEVTFGQAGDEVFVGDWDGDGVDTFALRRGNRVFVSNTLEGGDAEIAFWYGKPTDEVLAGDFDADGADSVIVRRGNQFHVTNALATGDAQYVVHYGEPGEPVLVGDLDGNGKDSFTIRRGDAFHLKETLAGGRADRVVTLGAAADPALLGDWDGDGVDTLGVVTAR